MKTGKQYRLDDKFKKAARLHQSIYRAEVLQVEEDEYGNRLKEDEAKRLLNYYDKLNSRQVLRDRYPGFSKKRDADLLRSEHIPFNLLAPLATDQFNALEVIRKAFGIDCVEIIAIEIEFAPEPKTEYLNDGTAFDTYIEIRKPDGIRCGIGIEVKYTEQSYKIGVNEKINVENHDSLYWRTARAAHCFVNPDDGIFGTDALRQIWRNHLLGLAMMQRGDVDEFYSITLFPNGNDHFHSELPRYISQLKDNHKRYVVGCTFEEFISTIGGSPEFDEWKAWLERRYVVR